MAYLTVEMCGRGGLEIKCLCFDIDGTLYDLRAMREAMFKELLMSLVLRKITFNEIRILRSYRKTLEVLRREVKVLDETLAQLHTRMVAERIPCSKNMVDQVVEKWMVKIPCCKLPNLVWPNTKDTLVQLKENGYRLAILSDYPANEKIKAMGLDDVFEVILSCQDSTSTGYKPYTNGFERLAACLNVEPQQCVYIGNSYKQDVCGALQNKMDAILLNPHFSKTKEQPCRFKVINKFSDLPGILI